ncbi:hypothetical protein T03_13925 [Trichinella britovi]|uniref:Uncharacterized protein n=1 Tax=Trichinella britovi TaxID=45882 RepID=A0A0V1CE54_TRIBR|nr:hypothetical protein T03_13925 [Trichinella britovi]
MTKLAVQQEIFQIVETKHSELFFSASANKFNSNHGTAFSAFLFIYAQSLFAYLSNIVSSEGFE